jgi:hypothetical protein
MCSATILGTVASSDVPLTTMSKLARLAIEHRTLRDRSRASSTIPRRSPLYETMTWS